MRSLPSRRPNGNRQPDPSRDGKHLPHGLFLHGLFLHGLCGWKRGEDESEGPGKRENRRPAIPKINHLIVLPLPKPHCVSALRLCIMRSQPSG